MKEKTEKKLREYIRQVILDVQDEEETKDEATTTANVPGYQTPYAFSGNSEEDEEDREEKLRRVNKQYGYTLVNDITSPEAMQDFKAFFGPLAKKNKRIKEFVERMTS